MAAACAAQGAGRTMIAMDDTTVAEMVEEIRAGQAAGTLPAIAVRGWHRDAGNARVCLDFAIAGAAVQLSEEAASDGGLECRYYGEGGEEMSLAEVAIAAGVADPLDGPDGPAERLESVLDRLYFAVMAEVEIRTDPVLDAVVGSVMEDLRG